MSLITLGASTLLLAALPGTIRGLLYERAVSLFSDASPRVLEGPETLKAGDLVQIRFQRAVRESDGLKIQSTSVSDYYQMEADHDLKAKGMEIPLLSASRLRLETFLDRVRDSKVPTVVRVTRQLVHKGEEEGIVESENLSVDRLQMASVIDASISGLRTIRMISLFVQACAGAAVMIALHGDDFEDGPLSLLMGAAAAVSSSAARVFFTDLGYKARMFLRPDHAEKRAARYAAAVSASTGVFFYLLCANS